MSAHYFLLPTNYCRNCNVFLALLIGYFIAGVSNDDGDSYVNTDAITQGKPLTVSG